MPRWCARRRSANGLSLAQAMQSWRRRGRFFFEVAWLQHYAAATCGWSALCGWPSRPSSLCCAGCRAGSGSVQWCSSAVHSVRMGCPRVHSQKCCACGRRLCLQPQLSAAAWRSLQRGQDLLRWLQALCRGQLPMTRWRPVSLLAEAPSRLRVTMEEVDTAACGPPLDAHDAGCCFGCFTAEVSFRLCSRRRVLR